MKTIKIMLTIALFAAATAAQANNYDYDAQGEVVVSEEYIPTPTAGYYGEQSYGTPSWAAGGCCERQPSKADHLWDNYCVEKQSHGCAKTCCGKSYCGTGPYRKGCSSSKCGAKFSLPKLSLPKVSFAKGCCQKRYSSYQASKCCQTSRPCRKPLLSKLKLFRGCQGSKCSKGKGAIGGMLISGPTYGANDLPAPAIEGQIIERSYVPNETYQGETYQVEPMQVTPTPAAGENLDMPEEVPPAPPSIDPAA